MKKVTHHAKMRINERGNNIINTHNKTLAKNVIKNGIELREYQKYMGYSSLIRWIMQKKGIKNLQNYLQHRYFLYKDFLFIFTGNLNKLITTYKIPNFFVGEIAKYPVVKELNQNSVSFHHDRNHFPESFEILYKLDEGRYKNPKFYFEKEKDARSYSLKIGLTNPLVKEKLDLEIKSNLTDKEIINNCIKKELIIIRKVAKEDGLLFND